MANSDLAPFTNVDWTLLAFDLRVRVRRRHKQMFWKSYETWQCNQTSETKLSSLQGKKSLSTIPEMFPARSLQTDDPQVFGKTWIGTTGNLLEDGENNYSVAFFSHQVTSLHWKPFNFKIALIASHKLPHGSQPFQRCSFWEKLNE